MASRFGVLALGAVAASAVRNQYDAPTAPIKADEFTTLGFAMRSPWLHGSTRNDYNGFRVTWKGILGESVTGVNGAPGKLSFSKIRANGSTPKAAANFDAVFKREWYDNSKQYPTEIELTTLAAVTNGLSLGLIQGAHTEEEAFMLSDYIPGEDFAEAVIGGKETVIDEYLARSVVAQIIYSLKKLEEQRILHRDIKRENFILAPKECHSVFRRDGPKGLEARQFWTENKCKVVLIDYGMACTYDEEIMKAQKRSIGCRKFYGGTKGYNTPEALSTEGYGSVRADVFAAGVLLYVLFQDSFPQVDVYTRAFGQPPPDKEVPRILLTGALTFNLQSDLTDEFMGKVPEGMRATLATMMHRRPSHRPSAADLWDDSWLDWSPSHGTVSHDKVGALDKDHYRRWVENVAAEALLEREPRRAGVLFPAIVDSPVEKQLDAQYEARQDRLVNLTRRWNKVSQENMDVFVAEGAVCIPCLGSLIDAILKR